MHHGLLILSGGGHMDEIHSLRSRVVNIFSQQSKAKVLIIPFAADEEDHDDIREYVEGTIGSGFKEIDMLDSPEKINETDLSKYSLVYLEGGNTFDLLKTIRSTALMTELIKYFKAGGAVFGDSAGAIVLGADAATAFFGDAMDDNVTGLQHFTGMNLIDSWSVHCHYNPEEDEECQDFVYSSGTQLIAIPEDAAVVLERNGTATVYGQRPVAVFSFTGKTVFKPTDVFSLATL